VSTPGSASSSQFRPASSYMLGTPPKHGRRSGRTPASRAADPNADIQVCHYPTLHSASQHSYATPAASLCMAGALIELPIIGTMVPAAFKHGWMVIASPHSTCRCAAAMEVGRTLSPQSCMPHVQN
jgi:hypothetical protein